MANTYTMSWADEPQQEGTPLNKATLLSDTVAAALRLPQEDPTVNDALACIEAGFSRVHVSNASPSALDIKKAGDIWINQGGIPYLMYVSLGIGVWVGVPVSGKTLKTEIFTTSTTWTVPSNIYGDVRIIVYGGGGAGYCTGGGGEGASGGGGGYMAEYIGKLTKSSYVITVGEGGADQSDAGGSSAFGDLISAPGGSGGTYTRGGPGGSGGGGRIGGRGDSFGGGSGSTPGAGSTNNGTKTKGGNGVDTTNLGVPDNAIGSGEGGTTSTTNDGGFGGGGGYGGKGGNGSTYGCGGGGGYGSGGNGGNGSSGKSDRGGDGGIGAGGGGGYYTDYHGRGGSGIVVIQYYI